jgi:hypothetical protein
MGGQNSHNQIEWKAEQFSRMEISTGSVGSLTFPLDLCRHFELTI